MVSPLQQKGKIKRPQWMRNKPFPKKTGPTFMGNLILVILVAILAMILYY